MNSASGFAGYLGAVNLDWTFLLEFTAVSVLGALVGTALAARVPQAALKRGFAVFLLAAGVFVLHRNRDVFRGGHSSSTSPTHAAPAASTR